MKGYLIQYKPFGCNDDIEVDYIEYIDYMIKPFRALYIYIFVSKILKISLYLYIIRVKISYISNNLCFMYIIKCNNTYDVDIVSRSTPGHTPDIQNLYHYMSVLTCSEWDKHL